LPPATILTLAIRPSAASSSRSCLRLGVLAETCAGCRTTRHLLSRKPQPNPTSPRPMRQIHRATSLEVLSPSALTGRDALSGAASLRTIPLRRCSPPSDPRVRGPPLDQRRPCGLPPCECNAVLLDVRTVCGLRFARALRCSSTASSAIVRASIGRRIRFDRAHERSVTSSATALRIRRLEPGHAPSRSFGAVFRYRAIEPSRPGRAMGLSLLTSPGGAHGVQYPSQACSRDGWLLISEPPGPRAD